MIAGVHISVLVVIIGAGLALAPMMLFSTSCLYFLFMHFKGTKIYLLKTIAIGLLSVPVALLISILGFYYLISMAWLWTHRLFQKTYRRYFSKDLSDSHQDKMDNRPVDANTVIVHLVHGTFETEAPWTKPGSAMRKAIEDINPEAHLVRFNWSGGNTPGARTLAAKELADKILCSTSEQHYIIAHSHGGNIVREMSHSYPNTANKVRGVCLLSPPFLYRKVLSRSANRFLATNVFGFTFALLIPITALYLAFGLTEPAIIALCVPLAALLEIWLTKRCRNSYKNESQAPDDSIAYNSVKIIHVAGDEADSALRFSSFVHEACFGVLTQLNSASEIAHKKRHTPFILSYFILFLFGIYTLVISQTTEFFTLLVGLITLALLHLAMIRRKKSEPANVLIAAALPITIFSFWLATAKALAYGDWRLIFCPEMFVSSSETPTGSHQILKLGPVGDSDMVHSTHSHPDAVQNIANWISASITGSQCRHTSKCEKCGNSLIHQD